MVDEKGSHETAEEKSGSKKESIPKSQNIAYNGKILRPEDVPDNGVEMSWGDPTHPHDYFAQNAEVPQDDYEDMSSLNKAINRTRRRIFHAKRYLDDARQEQVRAKTAYRHAYNKAFIGMSGGTEKHRQALAEIMVESEYSSTLVAEAKYEELKSLSYTLARELDALNTLANNLRKQMSIMD